VGRIALLGLFCIALGMPSLSLAVDVKAFQARSQKMGAGKTLVYRLFVPKEYQASKKYPLMLTLHGAGERGSDNSAQLLHDFNLMWAADSIQNPHPCFVVAPQCPVDSQWVNTPWAKGSYNLDQVPISEPMKSVVAILDSLAREFNIDADRVYVSGISMGGFGTWYLAMKYPDRFAAAVPVCGGADPKKAPLISKLPIWTFHAEDDGAVPVSGTREMVAALKAAGSGVKYTEYPAALGINHQSWVPAGKTPELWRWVFQQAKATVSVQAVKARGFPASGQRASAVAGGNPEQADALGKIHPGNQPPAPGFSTPLP
jgi:predicted peptidase